jgi:hypothetical protein
MCKPMPIAPYGANGSTDTDSVSAPALAVTVQDTLTHQVSFRA